MGTYIVRFEKKKCTGAGVCEAFYPERWKVQDDGKASLKGAVDKGDQVFELEISEAELERHKQAAEGCPPKCIHIINKDTGEELKVD